MTLKNIHLRSHFFGESVGAMNVCLLLLLSSCATLKTRTLLKSDSSSVIETAQDSTGISQTQLQEKLAFQYSDSAKNTSEVTIIPVGPFSYSPEKGFQGNASSILIEGSAAQWKGLAAIKEVNSNTEQATKVSDNENKVKIASHKETQNERKVTGRRIGWAVAVLAILAVSWVVSKKRFI